MCEADRVALLLSEPHVWFAKQCTDYVHAVGAGHIVFAGDWKNFDSEKIAYKHPALEQCRWRSLNCGDVR